MSGHIIAFCCEHSAYPAADLAGKRGLRYPESLRIVKVPCAGRVDILHILKALEKGAAGVLVLGCEEGACRHISGNLKAKERVKYSETLLKEIGMDGGRVGMFNLAYNAPHKFVRIAGEMSQRVKRSGEAK